jgi:arylsulfatase A-like enzyme
VPRRSEINGMFSAEDWVPTLAAAAGTPDIKSKLLQGYSADDKNFKVHLDGCDQSDLTTVTWSVCGTTNTRLCSWSSRHTV